MNFLFRAFHALPPLKTTKGTQTGAIYGLCQMILRIEREQKPTHLCVVYDAPGENFRYALYDQYKAHRPPMPPELAEQLGMVRRVVEAFGLAQLEVAGFEADDIIATLAKVARGAGHGRRDLLVRQGPDAALHRRRWRRGAGHDEEPADRAGRGAGEVRRRARAGGGRAGADGRQHRQRARAWPASAPRPPPS